METYGGLTLTVFSREDLGKPYQEIVNRFANNPTGFAKWREERDLVLKNRHQPLRAVEGDNKLYDEEYEPGKWRRIRYVDGWPGMPYPVKPQIVVVK